MEQTIRVVVLRFLLVMAGLALSGCDPLRLLPGPTIQSGAALGEHVVSQAKPDTTLE